MLQWTFLMRASYVTVLTGLVAYVTLSLNCMKHSFFPEAGCCFSSELFLSTSFQKFNIKLQLLLMGISLVCSFSRTRRIWRGIKESIGCIKGNDIIGNLRKLHRETLLFLFSVFGLEKLNRQETLDMSWMQIQ